MKLIYLFIATLVFSQTSWAHTTLHPHAHEVKMTLLLSKGKDQKSAKQRIAERVKTSPEDRILKIDPITVDGQPMYKIKLVRKGGQIDIVLIEKE